MRRILFACLLSIFATACFDTSEPKGWDLNSATNSATRNNTTTDPTNNTTTDPTNNTTTITTCEGPSFECVPACGGDWFAGSECVNGAWRCPTEDGPWIPIDDCPPGSCFGLPFPGEVCDDGFKCRPDIAGYGNCDGMICAVCEGFDPAIHNTASCQCHCTADGTVECFQPPACQVSSSSTLEGVELRLLGAECAWRRDQLAAGVTIGYEVDVDAALAPATTTGISQDAGGCGQADGSGLIVSYDIRSDSGDRYCLCDTGLCDPNAPRTFPLVGGSHSGSFEWYGANWDGPSDTGNPMGPPFAASEATVTVSAIGTKPDGTPFRVESSLPVVIVD